MLNYLSQHWYGRLSLKQSFWINLILISLIIVSIEYPTLIYLQSFKYYATIAIFWFITFHVLLFTWQIIGLIRCIETNLVNYENITFAKIARLVALLFLLANIIWAISLVQNIFHQNHLRSEAMSQLSKKADYTLSQNNDYIEINGLLSPGVTKHLKNQLIKFPNTKGVILNSIGGNIFQARGVGKLIIDNNLITLVTEKCLSSCTRAFIAGTKRNIFVDAKLGFHQYRIKSDKLMPRTLNTSDEQEKDLLFMRSQGVNDEFLEKIYNLSHEKMWYPTTSELIESGFINAIIY